jgi:hypothetical protein
LDLKITKIYGYPEGFGQSAMLTKPFTQDQLLQTAAQLVRSAPAGLHLHGDREPRRRL